MKWHLILFQFLFDHDTHKTYNWMDSKGMTPLYHACLAAPERLAGEELEKSVAVEMLLSGGADPAISRTGRLPIHVATDLGNLE